ncbi:MAG: TonB family protein [Burkholderiales bacterium]|nr:TonB family protein [Burkholderiales bacterium]
MRVSFRSAMSLTTTALVALFATALHAGSPVGPGKPGGPRLAALAQPPALTEAQALEALELDLSLKVGKKMSVADYPTDARVARQTGTAMVEVQVGGDGTVHHVALARSSGHALLDDRALHVVRRVTKLYMPLQLRGREQRAKVPIGFFLR